MVHEAFDPTRPSAPDADPPHAPSPDCGCNLCVAAAANLLDAPTFPRELGHEPVAELCREVA